MRATKLMLNAPTILSVMVCLLVSVFITSLAAPTAHAVQSIPYKINFQGRLTDAAGNIKPDGTYNMRIRMYDSLTNGNLLWTGDRSYTGSGSADHRVTITNGLFSIQLGDTATGVGDPVLPATLFNSQTYAGVYIEVQLASVATATGTTPDWSEAAMSPRSQLGAAPYAFNSDTLDGVDGANYARKDAANTFSQTNTFNKSITLQGPLGTDMNVATNSSIAFNQVINGSGKYIVQDTGGSAQILNGPYTGLLISVSAGKPSGAEAYNVAALAVQAIGDNVRGTIDNGITYGTNLISNPGFEFACTGWDNVATCAGDSSNARTGQQAAKFTPTTQVPSNASNSRYVAVKPGDSIYAQGYIKSSETTNGTAAIGINFFDKDGVYISTGPVSVSTNPGTTYAFRSTQAVVPANTMYATLAVVYYGGGTTMGMWYFDDVAMFNMTNPYPVINKNAVNSTSAYAIQNSSGSSLLNADTQNMEVTINGAVGQNTDLLTVDNAANPVTVNNANGIKVNYAGGAAAVEGSGMRIDYTPGTTSGGTWSGMRIVTGATPAVAGVSSYGLKIEGPTSVVAGSTNDVGLRIASGFDIGLDIASGAIQLSGSTEASIATPAMGDLRVYAKTNAGRTMLKMKGGSGVDVTLQPFLGSNRVSLYQPSDGFTGITNNVTLGTALAVSQYSTGTTVSTTATNSRTISSTNLFSTMKRTGINTSTGTGTVADLRTATTPFYRGNAAGLGGFYFVSRSGMSTYSATVRSFTGLAATASALTNQQVSANLNILGIGCDSADTTLSFMYNDASGTASKIALGANYPCNTSGVDMYELRLFSPPNGSTLYYSVARLNTTDFVEGSVTTDLPSNTTFLAPHFFVNNTTAATASMDISSLYVETDN